MVELLSWLMINRMKKYCRNDDRRFTMVFSLVLAEAFIFVMEIGGGGVVVVADPVNIRFRHPLKKMLSLTFSSSLLTVVARSGRR